MPETLDNSRDSVSHPDTQGGADQQEGAWEDVVPKTKTNKRFKRKERYKAANALLSLQAAPQVAVSPTSSEHATA